ncbi:methyltransferase [Capnocytophaga canimorsus]|uniref:Methyltransferase n=1 Tax=Capnocytophaga canimorsus TaxID=28188 RepID=A0A250G4Q7_9FLAO|nr:methyltransferase [Capnocytophaga canimorsus]ATA92382.1 methyltransferase [Capnocytophaga canimorsus]
MYKVYPKKRYDKTLALLKRFARTDEIILDLGVRNPFSQIMEDNHYKVINTQGEDLDFEAYKLKSIQADFVTALEILEHLVNPFEVLRSLPANKLLVTVPLRLWFAKAYRNKRDQRDCHYHEFEAWQFDMLLEKAGWEIKHRMCWTHPIRKLGIRPILRYFTPRYYAIYAEKKSLGNITEK